MQKEFIYVKKKQIYSEIASRKQGFLQKFEKIFQKKNFNVLIR